MVVLSWPDLAARLPSAAPPHLIDSALAPDKPVLDGTLTLFRERHGWCPYSERVWLALEAKNVAYDTVLIDNMGARPRWFLCGPVPPPPIPIWSPPMQPPPPIPPPPIPPPHPPPPSTLTTPSTTTLPTCPSHRRLAS